MSGILLLGFLLGMRHALEADHIAAVASLGTSGQSHRQAMFQGAVWGLGHSSTLLLACSAVLFLDTVIPERVAHGLESAVGAMLVLLGVDLFRRMRRDRIHFHSHQHDGGKTHFHAHSHAGENTSHNNHHVHDHPNRFPVHALYVGLMHGLAGSAALIVLTLNTVASPLTGLIYVGLFGVGSILGMAMLSLAISIPLRSARNFKCLHAGVQYTVGTSTIVVGSLLLFDNFRFILT